MIFLPVADVKAGLAALATNDRRTFPAGVDPVSALWAAGIYMARWCVVLLLDPVADHQTTVDIEGLRAMPIEEAVRTLIRHDILLIEKVTGHAG